MWFVFLVVLFGLLMDEEQFVIYWKYIGCENLFLEVFSEVWFIIGWCGGKFFIMVIIVVFLVCFFDYFWYFVFGECVMVMVIVMDCRQVCVIICYI